jgi:hypothetical protein
MKARRLPRGIYRRGDVLWIRFKNAEGKLSRESTGQGGVKVAESILAKRRSEVAMLSHFPSRKFEQVGFDDLLRAWEPRSVDRRLAR